ncbi:protein moonraker-like isoform X2 [Rhopilema esculentum]
MPESFVKEHVFPAAKYTNQLQFNLQKTSKVENLQTTFEKPKPLIIEKLPKSEDVTACHTLSSDVKSSTSSLTNHRLDLAMKLAKRDVKKLRSMLDGQHVDLSKYISSQEQQNDIRDFHKGQLEDKAIDNRQQQKQLKFAGNEVSKAKKPSIGKVVSGNCESMSNKTKKTHLRFFDSEGDEVDKKKIGEHSKEETAQLKLVQSKDKDSTDIKRLQKELQKYMMRLDAILEQKDSKRVGWTGNGKGSTNEQEIELAKKKNRAAEQAARSARILYMLQRKVQEIQDELQSKENSMRHTKKSHSLSRLAAAHRSAVRALQMFVNHAPAYHELNNGLPSMYKELGLLIQQLSFLSSHYESGKDMPRFDLDLLPKTKKLISSWDPQDKNAIDGKQLQPTQKAKDSTARIFDQHSKDLFLEKNKGWMIKKAKGIGFQTADEPTPERQAILQASEDALERARDSVSFLTTNVENEDVKVTKSHRRAIKDKKSVLFPHRIKKQRQRRTLASDLNKDHHLTSNRKAAHGMHFAKQTVSSVLKSHPEVNYEQRKTRPRSPTRSHVPDDVYVTHQSPRQRDADILRKATTSPRRLHQNSGIQQNDVSRPSDFVDHDYREKLRALTEKEAARQVWLDVEGTREMQRLQSLRKTEEERIGELRSGYMKTTAIVADAEKKIRERLQPLLEKAELLSLQERSKEEQYKMSVKRKLADLVSDTAVSRGDILADLILDDLLNETVRELYRLENEEIREANAALELMKPTVKEIAEKITDFEKEEEQIRRRWKKLHYSELDVDQEKKGISNVERSGSSLHKARPIIFTAAIEENNESRLKRTSQCTDEPKNATIPIPENTEFIPTHMRASILSYCRRHDSYLKRTVSEELDKFNPWTIVEKISDEIVDELVLGVEKELNMFCDDYIDEIYADEFLKNDSAVSESVSDVP